MTFPQRPTPCYFCRTETNEHAEDCPAFAVFDPEPWPRFGHAAGDLLDPELADFTIGPREVVCPTCWCVHRPDIDCEA